MSKKRESKMVIFDVDGTLADTQKGIIAALNYVYSVYDLPTIAHEDEKRYIGPPIKESFQKFGGMTATVAEKATALYRQIYIDKYIEDSILYSGMENVLKMLKKSGNLLAIATMKTEPQVNRLLPLLDIENYFEVIMCASEKGGCSKNSMLTAIKQQYTEVDSFVMIGDTMRDYEASIVSGMDFIAAIYGYGNFDSVFTAVDVADKPEDILVLV